MNARQLVQEIADLTDQVDTNWMTGFTLIVQGTSWKLPVHARLVISGDHTALAQLLVQVANTCFILATGHVDLPDDADPERLQPEDVFKACDPQPGPNIYVSGHNDEILTIDRQTFLHLPKVTNLQLDQT